MWDTQALHCVFNWIHSHAQQDHQPLYGWAWSYFPVEGHSDWWSSRYICCLDYISLRGGWNQTDRPELQRIHVSECAPHSFQHKPTWGLPSALPWLFSYYIRYAFLTSSIHNGMIHLHLPRSTEAFIQINLQLRQDSGRLRALPKDQTMASWWCWDLNSWPSSYTTDLSWLSYKDHITCTACVICIVINFQVAVYHSDFSCLILLASTWYCKS